MSLFTRVKAAALFGCILFASQSYAVDYVWTDGYTHGSNPAQVCDSIGNNMYPGDPRYAKSIMKFQSSTRVMCEVWFRFSSASVDQQSGQYIYLNRGGDSCPTGTGPYDPATGTCPVTGPPKQPGEKCDDQTGGTASNPMIWDDTVSQCVKFTESEGEAPCQFLKAAGEGNPGYQGTKYTVAGNISSTGQATAPPSFADGGVKCQVTTISSSECTLNVAGAVSCNVIGKFSGLANPSGAKDAADAVCTSDNPCPPKEPETKTSETGCAPVGTGGGGSTCTQTKATDQEGSQQCGTVNGAYKCITKQPYSNGINTTINASSQTLPDGSVKVTTVKESTNTVCTDVKTCTVKTSTTTTHSTTKPNGSTTTETSCKGACTPNGGGLETNPNAGTGNGNGTGTGGNGTCTGDDCGEGEGTAATTDSCLTPPACDGDPFQCAILKQAHIDTCKLMAPPTAAEQAAADAKVNAAYAALDAHQSALDQQASTLLGQFQSSTPGSGTGGGKCLPDFQFSVMGMSQSMEFSKVCDSISWVRLMVLAGAYLFAARIVSREV